jgi:hypothetical protein
MQRNNDLSDDSEHDLDVLDSPPISSPSRKRRFLLFSLLVLVLLIIIGILSPLRSIVSSRFVNANVTPTPTLLAGDNLFFIQSTPPGAISIDGHSLAHIPQYPNLDSPLHVSRGVHHITWQAAPFNPLTCTIYVPSLIHSQPCPYESAVTLDNGINARLITFTPSFSDLASSQLASLKQQIQQTLTHLQSTATVLPGEQYLTLNAAGNPALATATQTLKATLSFHLDADPDSPRSCVGGFGDTCNYNGQNCLGLCQYTYAESTWLVFALYYPTWTYVTQDGHILTQGQLDTNAITVGTDHTMLLQLSWSSNGWNVINESALKPDIQHPTIGQLTGINTTSKLACGSIAPFVKESTSYASTDDASHTPISWTYYVGNNLANGCLGFVVPSTSPKALPAYFLYRFGVLLAANKLAHQYFPSLPMADVYEQSIAQSIAQQNQQEIASGIDG